MKVLYVTTLGSTNNFFVDQFKMMQEKGIEIEIASNLSSPLPSIIHDMNIKSYDLPFSRSPLSKSNFKAYKMLKKIIAEGQYDIVHCHTPIAAALTRLACKKYRKKGLKVFYTAHGFHFYKGAPLKNWLVFYPIEWLCAFWTDKLITINTEDFNLAKKHMHSKEVDYIPGVGIDINKFSISVDKTKIKKELNLPLDSKILLSVGELNNNKNHQIVIKALSKICDNNLHYLIAGSGDQLSNLKNLVKSEGLDERVHFLGFRNDIPQIMGMADVYILPSIREGLNVSIMEAMSNGLPCVVSKIRGNVDLIDENGGAFFSPLNVDECKSSIENILNRDYNKMSLYNKKKITKFSKEAVNNKIKELYYI